MPVSLRRRTLSYAGTASRLESGGSPCSVGPEELYGAVQPPSALQLSAPCDTWAGRVNHSGSGAAEATSHTAARPPLTRSGRASHEHTLAVALSAAAHEEQRRCANTAYHVSFHGDSRVKLKPTTVELPSGVVFIVVDRFLSGNCDGVYERNRKMWDQVPVGQARVFARATAALAAGRSPPPSPPTAPLPPPHAAPSDWVRVASAVGLRKMGHWREATTVFSTHKDVARTAVALEKVDGEPGHIAAFVWGGERYWVVGCRYQHIVTRLDVPEADLMRYTAASSSGTGSSTGSSSGSSSGSSGGDGSGSASANSSSGGGVGESSSPTSPAVSNGFLADSAQASSVGQRPTPPRVHSPTSLPRKHDGAVAPPSGVASSEAVYLDLAVRMARLWRRVLEPLAATKEEEEEAAAAASSAWGDTSAAAQLHAQVAADNRSLCFDVIVSGWERLQNFSAARGFAVDAAASTTTTTATDDASDSSTATPSPPPLPPPPPSVAVPMWFYAVTWDAPLEERGWCMAVQDAFDFFERFHLPTTPRSLEVPLPSPALEELRQSVLPRGDSAGAVFYGSSSTGSGSGSGSGSGANGGANGGAAAAAPTVVQVWKCRAYPHSLERTVQEYVVTHRLCGEQLRSKMKKKVSSLSTETRLCIKQWELHRLPFLLDFALWLHREKLITQSTDLAALKVIRGHWLTYQERFQHARAMQQQQQQQRHSLRDGGLRRAGRTASSSSSCASAVTECGPSCDRNGQHAAQVNVDGVDSVLLVGPQGCGKSSMARTLYALLEEAGAVPRWLNQDEVGNRAAYLATIRRAAAPGAYSHLLLDKMNLDEKSRADYTAAGLSPALVLAWTHADGVAAMAETCCERVVQRGACHRTFCPDDVALLRPPSELPSTLSPLVLPVDAGVSSSAGVASGSTAAAAASMAQECVLHAGDAASAPSSPAAPPLSPPTRLHGILHASARRYQAPANVPLVELDVTWDRARMVAVAWEALREKGTRVLPPLTELHVAAALQTAYAYEQLLETYPARVASAILRGPASDVLRQQLHDVGQLPAIPKTQRLPPHIDVLLHDFHQRPSPTALVRYAAQVGCSRRVMVQAVVSNSKVTLLLLLLLLEPSETAVAPPEDPCGASAAPPAVREHVAVLAKAKKVTQEYCDALAQRVRDDPDEDPYCAVRWLSPPLEATFTVSLLAP
ncbi:hypothetical protein NESM_000514800 [Novymonas esmeraldas]|uniref:DUF7920 domain-containing protein n=1 Tax=Novymonas esmeraldas TaxID=1808958 RepID=A0AAW0ERL3_9TRYP